MSQDQRFTSGPAEYEDIKTRFLAEGSTWAPQHAHDVEVLLTEITTRALRESGESFDAVVGKMLGEAYSGKFVERLDVLDGIVRYIASPAWGRPYDADLGQCMFCGTEDPSPAIAVDDDYLAHEEVCPWRRARTLYAEKPASPAGSG